MKNFKKLTAVAAAAALLALGAASACAHSHNFSGWDYNESGHWHVCKADGEIDANSFAQHDLTGSSTCECGYNPATYVPGSGGTFTPPSGGGGTGGNGGSGSSSGGGNEFTPPAGGEISNNPVAGSVKITVAEGDLEAAYAEWEKLSGATWYNVYCKGESGDFVKLDAPLVREYKNNFRADAVGLKAGKYTLKVVPVQGATEKQDLASTATVNVSAHAREGYAFVNGTASGAYNEDGTLKPEAKVIYITDENKDSVSATLSVKGKEQTLTGLQNILSVIKNVTTPLDFRLIGQISSPSVEGSNNKNANTVLIKGDKKVNAPITFEGIGADATAFGWTLRLVQVKNVEVRNLGFMNTQASEPDDISLEDDEHVWVHNCDLFYGGAGSDSDQAKGDGALDTKTCTYITHSYNHFWDSGKCNLQGMKEEETTNYVTYHHNWYDHSDSRHPRIRTCTTHIYNNYFDGNAKYGVGVTTGASAFVENNYFRSTATMKPMLASSQGTDAKGEGTFSGEAGGIIKAFGNFFDGKYTLITQTDAAKTSDKTNIDCYLASSRDEQVPAEYKTKAGKKTDGAGTSYSNFDTAKDFYKYEVDTPEAAKTKVELYAGRAGGGDFKWTFDNAKEDANYAVIAALKTALTSYKTSLVKIGS